MEDIELTEMIPFLKAIAENEEKDVRKVLKKYENNFYQYIFDFSAENSKENKKILRKELRDTIV